MQASKLLESREAYIPYIGDSKRRVLVLWLEQLMARWRELVDDVKLASDF